VDGVHGAFVMDTKPNSLESVASEIISIPPLWRLQLVRFIEILGVIAMFLGGAEFLNLLNTLPTGTAPQWAFLIGGTVNKTAKPVIMFFGDWFDDGVFNKSFRIEPIAPLIALMLVICLLPSCAGIGAGITGQPIRTTPVQRADGSGKPFELASSDLFRAETQPGKAWGLYDAGAVADATGQVVESGK